MVAAAWPLRRAAPRARREVEREGGGAERCVRRLAQAGLACPRICRNARAIVAAQPSGSLSAGKRRRRARARTSPGSSPATLRSVAVGARTPSSPASTSAGAPASAAPAGSTGSGRRCGQLDRRPARARAARSPRERPAVDLRAGAGAASSWQALAAPAPPGAQGPAPRPPRAARADGVAVQRCRRGGRELASVPASRSRRCARARRRRSARGSAADGCAGAPPASRPRARPARARSPARAPRRGRRR